MAEPRRVRTHHVVGGARPAPPPRRTPAPEPHEPGPDPATPSSGARGAHGHLRVEADGVVVDRWERDPLLDHVRHAVSRQRDAALAIASINLDHFTYFGQERQQLPNLPEQTGVTWVMLADGAPVANRAARVTGTSWPRLTGADLLPEILRAVQADGALVGFLGGTPVVHEALRRVLAQDYPRLRTPLFWAPPREVVDSEEGSAALAAQIAEEGVDVVCVALGKPRQELWIQTWGEATGASVLLAFGASADFIAGKTRRAPEWAQQAGLEWAFRLGQEPRRLARRYLVQAPVALTRLRKARPVQ